MVPFSSRLRKLLAAALLAALVGVAAARAAGPLAPPRPGDAPYETWIDERAPGLFDAAAAPARSLHVAYRVDARIMLPLGFTTLQLWSRPDVGSATASYRDHDLPSGDIVRGYELFTSSKPERARGLNRMGFFREAIRLARGGPEWTAYFGAMTASPERTYGEAAKANDSGAERVYDATDGLTSPRQATSAVFRIETTERVDSADALYALVRPDLGRLTPRRNVLTGSPSKPLPPSAFLGALEETLQQAAARRDGSRLRPAVRVPFVHNGVVRQLEISGLTPDPTRGARFAAARFVRSAGQVFAMQYRIVTPGHDDFTFRLWAELPAGAREDPLAPPIPPLAWEIQVRSFLRLYYERVR